MLITLRRLLIMRRSDVMVDIEKIIEGLVLIETVTPSYKRARRKGIVDDDAEVLVNQAIEQAIAILEQVKPLPPTLCLEE